MNKNPMLQVTAPGGTFRFIRLDDLAETMTPKAAAFLRKQIRQGKPADFVARGLTMRARVTGEPIEARED